MNMSAIQLSKFLVFLVFTTLSSAVFSKMVSGIDQDYKLGRSFSKNALKNPKSPGTSFYQSVLSKTLGSRCKMYPSDSAYNQVLAQKCPKWRAALKSMDRFYLEPNAQTAGLNTIVKDGIYHVQLPDNCRLY